MQAFMAVLKALFSSKKFVAMLVGIVATLLAKIGLDVDDATVTKLVGVVVSFILGQGIADHGKEAAKIAKKASSNGT